MILKCPSCKAVLYSRSSGVCSECHASLPKEMLLSEEEKRRRDTENTMMKLWVEQSRQKANRNPVKKMLG